MICQFCVLHQNINSCRFKNIYALVPWNPKFWMETPDEDWQEQRVLRDFYWRVRWSTLFSRNCVSVFTYRRNCKTIIHKRLLWCSHKIPIGYLLTIVDYSAVKNHQKKTFILYTNYFSLLLTWKHVNMLGHLAWVEYMPYTLESSRWW